MGSVHLEHTSLVMTTVVLLAVAEEQQAEIGSPTFSWKIMLATAWKERLQHAKIEYTFIASNSLTQSASAAEVAVVLLLHLCFCLFQAHSSSTWRRSEVVPGGQWYSGEASLILD